MTDTPYRSAALDQVWALVGQIDRNPHSPTRGSFSRTHWAWKFTDFPYPRFQEGVYALARLHDLDVPGNPVHASPAAARWIDWGFDYWASLQHANGAYDEAYPFEQCLAATAFTSFYLGHAFLRWRDRLDPSRRDRLVQAFARAGGWLQRNDETHGLLSNHLAVAVAGLEVIGRITGDASHAERARFFLDRIFAHQSAEGWMQEYDGADIGYGTHGFFYLAEYWRQTGCPRTEAALGRFAEFLACFVHPDGTIGGEYASRNTEFYYPAGFEILAARIPACASIAAGLRPAIRSRAVCGVWGMDDFNRMPMLNNLLFAMDAAVPDLAAAPLPWQGDPFRRVFPEAGLWVINEPSYYAVVGLSKGGTVSVFDKAAARLGARHSGLLLEAGGRTLTSQDYTAAPEVRWDDDGAVATLDVPWKRVRMTTFGPWLFMAFRLFTMTVGRWAAASRAVKAVLVYALIRRKSRPPIRHVRVIAAGPEGIEIRDAVAGLQAGGRLSAVEQFTAVHMGSSLYADIRTAGPMAAGAAWTAPADGAIRLRARLTPLGAAWQEIGD